MCSYCDHDDGHTIDECPERLEDKFGTGTAELRDSETRDDDQGHADATAAQLALADDEDLERAGIDPDEDDEDEDLRCDGSFEYTTRTATFSCDDCNDFELEKSYSGIAGTPGEEEYDRIQAPETCPACGGPVTRDDIATDGGTDTKQETITDEDPFEATITVDDLVDLAAALEPIEGRVTLECTTSQLSVAAHDVPNVYATRVAKPIDATQPETLVVETDDLADAVADLWWQDDDAQLEIRDADDGRDLCIFDGEANRMGYEAVPLFREKDAQEPPTFERMIDACNWQVCATAEAWELAGTLRTVAAPADYRVDVMIEDTTFAAIGNNNSGENPWPYCDTFDLEVERASPVSPCPLSADYMLDVADALPLEATVTIRYGADTPLWLATDTGVELFLAPRILDEEDDDGPRCQNCGTHVLPRTPKIFGDETDTLWHCFHCPGISIRDLKFGAGTTPDYDPAVDRGRTSENQPLFNPRGDDE